jgi:hypothetical protein
MIFYNKGESGMKRLAVLWTCISFFTAGLILTQVAQVNAVSKDEEIKILKNRLENLEQNVSELESKAEKEDSLKAIS